MFLHFEQFVVETSAVILNAVDTEVYLVIRVGYTSILIDGRNSYFVVMEIYYNLRIGGQPSV